MKFIDLFSGIGGFRSALENNGHECLAFAEIDKHARQSYKAIYNTENEQEWHDVTRITDDDFRYFKGKADIIVGGFPCQAFSIAGKRKGFEDTRGTLFFEIARAIKEIQPSYVLLENVKGLFSHDGGRTFGTIIQALDELGYVTEWGLFNSKYWGVPQNRERVYILATRKDKFKQPKLFDLVKQQTEVTTRLIDVLEDEVDEKYYLSEEKTRKLTLDHDLSGKLNFYNYNETDKVYSVNKVGPTLNTMQGGNRQPKIAVKGFKEVVKVRKYDVNKLELSELLRISKQDAGISNKEISEKLNIPITKVEHWFRTDKSFAIPDASVWFELKQILNITNTDHDEAITTFISKESNFDTTNRIYDTNHLSPTLNTTSEPKIAVLGNTSHTGYKAHDVHDINELSPTIAARDYKGPKQIAVREATKQGYAIAEQGDSVNVTYPDSKTRRGRVDKQVAQTLQDGEVNQGVVIDDTQGYDGVRTYEGISPTLRSSRSGLKTIDNLRIRKLVPIETWRLQGFTDDQFYKAKESGVSNSQLYKQSGNSVTVNVVDAIVKQLKE